MVITLVILKPVSANRSCCETYVLDSACVGMCDAMLMGMCEKGVLDVLEASACRDSIHAIRNKCCPSTKLPIVPSPPRKLLPNQTVSTQVATIGTIPECSPSFTSLEG